MVPARRSSEPVQGFPAPGEDVLAGAAEQLKEAIARFLGLIEPLRLELWGQRGLTITQLRLILSVRTTPGASTGEVGAAMGMSGSSLTGLVDRVAALGFIRREPDVHDWRVTRLWLSDRGGQFIEELQGERSEEFDRVFERLAPGRRVLLAELFEEFVAAAEAEAFDRGALPHHHEDVPEDDLPEDEGALGR